MISAPARSSLGFAAAVVLVALVVPTLFSAPTTQPNILFILADDLGWTGLSCYGNKDVATPNLDRLAAQGMRFTQAYADAQCSPTRAAFLSGQFGRTSRRGHVLTLDRRRNLRGVCKSWP